MNDRVAGTGRIRRISVDDFSFFMGDSPNVASSAFPGTAYGAWVRSADYVTLNGKIRFNGDNTAPSGWRLAVIDDCLRPDIKIDCPKLTSGGGFELVDSTRPVVRGSDVTGSNDMTAEMVRITSCPGTELLDNNMLNQKTGLNVGLFRRRFRLDPKDEGRQLRPRCRRGIRHWVDLR